MKKTIFLLLIAPLAFSACKKDKTENAEQTIVGKWTEKSLAYDYYNSAGTKVFSETEQGGATWEFNANSVTYTATGSTPRSSAYTISTVSGKKMISFANPNVGENLVIEINSITNNSMTWSSSSNNVEYYDGGVKTAAKATLVITFAK